MQQVDKQHYDFARYSHPGRWVSYYHQLSEIIKRKPKSILEVGVGDKVFGSFIKHNTDIDYKSIDVAPDLKPDILGDIEKMPLADSSYDVVCAFEVLEHLPFEKFESAIGEMSRVSRKYVAISVPHFGPPVQFLLKIPFLPLMRFAFKIPFPKAHAFNGQHYWEIGKKGFPVSAVREKLLKKHTIVHEFVPFENQYHHFFILEKKDTNQHGKL